MLSLVVVLSSEAFPHGLVLLVNAFRFTLVQKHTVEFNQVAMANSEGSEVMLNRVMTKDNIGVAVLLEVNKDMFSGGKSGPSLCGVFSSRRHRAAAHCLGHQVITAAA